jgi:hypothetical protein
MANLTKVVDNEVLRQAQIRALEQGTTINAVLGEYLENYAGCTQKYKKATARILELTNKSTAASNGQHWTRDDIYER